MRMYPSYSCSYVDSDSRLDYLKYGLSNDYGYNLDGNKNRGYKEDSIIKKTCIRYRKNVKKS